MYGRRGTKYVRSIQPRRGLMNRETFHTSTSSRILPLWAYKRESHVPVIMSVSTICLSLSDDSTRAIEFSRMLSRRNRDFTQ